MKKKAAKPASPSAKPKAVERAAREKAIKPMTYRSWPAALTPRIVEDVLARIFSNLHVGARFPTERDYANALTQHLGVRVTPALARSWLSLVSEVEGGQPTPVDYRKMEDRYRRVIPHIDEQVSRAMRDPDPILEAMKHGPTSDDGQMHLPFPGSPAAGGGGMLSFDELDRTTPDHPVASPIQQMAMGGLLFSPNDVAKPQFLPDGRPA